MQITAAVVEQVHGRFLVRDVELDEPGPGEVLVKDAVTASYEGAVIKPALTMPH
jgi:Zn-dependent alcohol dehydrogenase